MDTCASASCEMSIEDKRTIKVWDESAQIVDSHYEMKIPFKSRPPNLMNNYSVAESRLESLGRRLKKDENMFDKYESGIQQLVKDGHAEKVKEEDVNKSTPVWYIPHHGVTSASKPDKLRIVFDCSAKYNGTSLNEQVYKGPALTNKLLGVLLRFRQGPIAVMGDIKGMFHQVKVPDSDRDLLRFLWFSDINKQPEVYRLTVHLFGGIWSPSCATYAVQRTAEDNQTLFDPEVVQTVLKNFYVDDCLRSMRSETRAIAMVRDLCKLLSLGGFTLNKWLSNSREVIDSIPSEMRAERIQSVDLFDNELPLERALGVLWDTENDEFGFRIKLKEKPKTRRGILSMMTSVYDPLGLVSPYILLAKKVFQDETRLRKGWDEQLSTENFVKWTEWIENLWKLEQCRFARCVIPNAFADAEIELHHFSDASSEGYGAVSYIRMVNESGEILCHLLTSKSRLAPLKQLTIPRLELSAAVISVKLDMTLRSELDVDISRSVFWTDSLIVIQYIHNESRRFSVFVANRVSQIHEGSRPDQWRHVDSADNPADDVSRGLEADKIVISDRWKHGPGFLSKSEEFWPVMPQLTSDTREMEVKKLKSYGTVTVEECDPFDALFSRYSSWYKLKRAVAWLLRLKKVLLNRAHKCKCEMFDDVLNADELKYAESAIVKVLQMKAYSKEFKHLENKSSVEKSSTIYKLEPMINEDGVLCIRGRLQTAPVSGKHQAILPRDSPVTELIIRHFHEVSGHSGKEYVLSLIRQQFWIPKGRKTVSRILGSCVSCKKRLSAPQSQRMANLPSDRISPGDPPFTNVGLDCFGPFMVKRGRAQVKRYGCIFTCLVSKAVHLEVLHGLDTDSFLNGFVRFISRRGCPAKMYSDNGTNFHCANKELKEAFVEWNSQHVKDFMCKKEICWLFNPPAASHMGGVWERLIRSVRTTMDAILGTNSALDDDGLQTIFCEIKSILNGRPITAVSDDPRDMEPLTPNHILLLRSGPDLSVGSFRPSDVYRKRLKYIQHLADMFWSRWTKEYLPSLQLRQKWIVPKRNLVTGDIVLIKNENTSRKCWPLARVTETFCGKDGLVRTAAVRTETSTLTRPVTKLCLLEGLE